LKEALFRCVLPVNVRSMCICKMKELAKEYDSTLSKHLRGRAPEGYFAETTFRRLVVSHLM